MRKWFFLATFLVAGCGDATTQTVSVCAGEVTDEAASMEPLIPTPACVPTSVVETELPTVAMGTMVAICTDCDVSGCDGLGAPCAAYGSACNFGGEPGVCVACCNGIAGELRCKPIN